MTTVPVDDRSGTTRCAVRAAAPPSAISPVAEFAIGTFLAAAIAQPSSASWKRVLGLCLAFAFGQPMLRPLMRMRSHRGVGGVAGQTGQPGLAATYGAR
jgi:hypothetical protein